MADEKDELIMQYPTLMPLYGQLHSNDFIPDQESVGTFLAVRPCT